MKTSKEERANMTKDQMIRTLWLLDEYIDMFGWHFVSEDGFPKPNRHGFWCKLIDGNYCKLYYDNGFYTQPGSYRIYIHNDNDVIAWQRLTEISM